MGRPFSNIKKANEFDTGLTNYINYLQGIDTAPTKRTAGGTPGANKPRQYVAVQPFGRETQGLVETSVSERSFEKLTASLAARTKADTTSLTAAVYLKNFKPAKVIYFEPVSDSGSYVQSKLTKLYYLKRQGESFTAPFGATSETEEEETGAQAIKIAVYNLAPGKQARQVSITPEKIFV